MPAPSHNALRIILKILALLTAVGGLVLIFSGRPMLLRMPFHPPESEVTTMLLFVVKEMGGMILMVSVMFFLASRDPVRNVAILDALIIGLCVLAITPLVSLYTLDARSLYPAYLIWGRAVGRLVLAAVFYYLRPREGEVTRA
jgi:hypothetical protein